MMDVLLGDFSKECIFLLFGVITLCKFLHCEFGIQYNPFVCIAVHL